MIFDGTPENDNLTGTEENDTITGLDGNDLLNGGLGDDSIDGGAGDDTVIGGLGNDTIFGGIGTDILNGEGGDDLIAFGAGAKTVNGGDGSDRLYLDYSDQTEDFILTYNVFEGPSPTVGGILDGSQIESIERVDVFSGAGNDFIEIATASVGSEIAGGAGDDALIGGLGDDTINAEAGNDTFFGGAGNDVLSGGEGNDATVFRGLGSDYEVVIGETAITVTGGFSPAIELEPGAEPVEPPVEIPVESFTDTLSTDIEIILFDNGEVITATGEFTAFDATDPPANAANITIGTDADLAIPEPTVPDPEEDPAIPIIDDANIDGIPVFEFLSTDTQTQFYTTEARERDAIIESLPQYELEGISFVGAEPPAEGEDITGISPVYRFFNTITGVHLYTADERERAFVAENLDNFVFEGIPYYGFDTQEEGTVPLYRFYNESLGAHFYTSSEEERASFVESPDFEPEGSEGGIAFYVQPAPEVL